jgi:hypothetical protein
LGNLYIHGEVYKKWTTNSHTAVSVAAAAAAAAAAVAVAVAVAVAFFCWLVDKKE